MKDVVAELETLTTGEEEEERLQEAEEPTGPEHDPIRVYFQQMGKYPLLTREDEVLLAKEMEAGKAAMLEALLTTRLVQREVAALVRHIEAGKAEPADLLDYPDLSAQHVAVKWTAQRLILERLLKAKPQAAAAGFQELPINGGRLSASDRKAAAIDRNRNGGGNDPATVRPGEDSRPRHQAGPTGPREGSPRPRRQSTGRNRHRSGRPSGR